MASTSIQIVLVRPDGALLLHHDAHAGSMVAFGGPTKEGEGLHEAAARLLADQTGIHLKTEQLRLYGRYEGQSYFVARDIDPAAIKLPVGQRFVAVSSLEEAKQHAPAPILLEFMDDYYSGARAFTLLPSATAAQVGQVTNSYYQWATRTARRATGQLIALTALGDVAAGKTTVVGPLARHIGAVQLSSDLIREHLYRAGFNFDPLKTIQNDLVRRAIQDSYHIWLDMNAATNLPHLQELREAGYRVLIVHANPPRDWIMNKIKTGNMRHELSFFKTDEAVLRSFHMWEPFRQEARQKLLAEFDIWHSVDTSSPDFPHVIAQLKQELLP